MNQQKKNSVFLNLAILLAFTFAMLWSIDGAVAIILLGLTLGFFVLHWLVNITNEVDDDKDENISLDELLRDIKVKKEESNTSNQNKKEQEPRHFQSTGQHMPLVKKILSSIGYIILGLLVFIIGFAIFSNEEVDTTFDNFSVETLVVKGDNSYTYSDYDSALFYYTLAKTKNPNYPGVWLGLGNLKYANNEIDSALIYYQKSVAIDARFSQGRYNIAWWYYAQKKYSEATSRLLVLVKDEPSNGQALQLLGDVYYEQKDFNNSFIWYEKAYQANYKNGWLCHVLGYLYDTRSQTNKAIELYKEAIYFDANNVDVYVRLGELLPGMEGEEYRKKAAELKK